MVHPLYMIFDIVHLVHLFVHCKMGRFPSVHLLPDPPDVCSVETCTPGIDLVVLFNSKYLL